MEYDKILSSEQVINELNLILKEADIKHCKLIDVVCTHQYMKSFNSDIIYNFCFIIKKNFIFTKKYETEQIFEVMKIGKIIDHSFKNIFISAKNDDNLLESIFGKNCQTEYSSFSIHIYNNDLINNMVINRAKLRELIE